MIKEFEQWQSFAKTYDCCIGFTFAPMNGMKVVVIHLLSGAQEDSDYNENTDVEAMCKRVAKKGLNG